MGLCRRVADIYLAPLLKEAPKEESPISTSVTLSPLELEALAGNYRGTKFGMWLSLSVKENALVLGEAGGGLTAVPLSPTRFQAMAGTTPIVVEFLPEEKGKPRRVKLSYGTEEADEFTQAPPVRPLTPAGLTEYVGDYESAELLGAVYHLVADKGNLIVKFRSASRSPLKLMAPDQFTLEGVSLDFVRDRTGAITGAKLSTGRAAGIVFAKVK